MSKKPPCYQDPDVFEEDNPDCLDCDFYGACRVLSSRILKQRSKNKRKTRTATGRKSKKELASRGTQYDIGSLFNQAPTVDHPGMGFIDKLLWNTIRQSGSTVFGEIHRAWDESIPRVRYTSILKHLERPADGGKNDEAQEEDSESDSD